MEPAAGTAAAPVRRRLLWTLVAVGLIAVGGGAAGAYFGLHAARGTGSAQGAAPAARAYAAVAYDEASHQVVLFGGMSAGGAALGDTWTWDGSSWTEQHPSVSPPPRASAATTYDPHGRDLVLVGGRQVQASGGPIACSGSGSASANAIPPVVPTTQHVGTPVPTTTGHQPAPSTAQGSPPPAIAPVPPSSTAPCIAATPPPVLNDTWTWDGSQWHRTGAAPPTGVALDTPALATDPTTGQVMLLSPTAPQPEPLYACPVPAPGSGGVSCRPPAPQAVHAWTWSGSAWQQVSEALPAAQMPINVGGTGALVADPTSGHLAVFRSGAAVVCGEASAAGEQAMPCPLGEGSAVANGGAQAPPGTVPPPAGVPPTKPSSAVCCAGSVTVWNGNGWAQPRSLPHSPTVFGTALAGDAAHHSVLAYTPEATWQWNGSSWSELHPSRSPGRVVGAAVVYDGSSGRVLLFGGLDTPLAAQPGYTNALWAWDGTTWTLLGGAAPSPSPSPSPTPTPTPGIAPPSTPGPPPPVVPPCVAATPTTSTGSSTPPGQPPLSTPTPAPSCPPLPSPTPAP